MGKKLNHYVPYKHCLKCQNWASSGPLRVAAGQYWPGYGPVLVLKAMFIGLL